MRQRNLLCTFLTAACATACATETPREVPPPLTGVHNAFESAARVQLPEIVPAELDGLHNLVRLSDRIVSGSEPHGEAAFERLERMGVRTLVSVDGKVPDAEAAARHGIRTVHVPIQYKGFAGDELAKLAKTFRELDGPFYVHCFHGKHRGPAAAAVGRLVADGVPREQALAEMRQWCGTSKKYEGLYLDIATAIIPDAQETEAFSWDFDEAAGFEGSRGAMVGLARVHDNLALLADAGWVRDPEHPDLDAASEATQLFELFTAGVDASDSENDEYRGWLDDSVSASADLRAALALLAAGDATGAERADAAFDRVAANCSACHKAYRNR